MPNQNGLVLFQTADEKVMLSVPINGETVWLSRNQIADLFGRDVKTIGKHINNAISDELVGFPTVAKFATVQIEGDRTVERSIDHYNLDVIISVGYRVKSNRGLEFRRWANTVLKEHILKGYSINTNRIKQLGKVIKILKRAENSLDAKQVLSVIESYSAALNLLDDYDHQRIGKPKGTEATYILTYDECKQVIAQMRFIAAIIFLYFLDKNDLLFSDGEKIMEDNTLVAITIMIAESKPEEKEAMVNLVMNFLE